MSAQQLLNQILPLLHTIKEDKEKLAKLLAFMEEEFLQDKEDEYVESEK